MFALANDIRVNGLVTTMLDAANLNKKNSTLFSSPEQKAQVSYCHSMPSICHPSSPEQIDGF